MYMKKLSATGSSSWVFSGTISLATVTVVASWPCCCCCCSSSCSTRANSRSRSAFRMPSDSMNASSISEWSACEADADCWLSWALACRVACAR
uniref:Putative secreted peptide n=1 Tax=Anopheles braziliensis TaxID=58242 RepID=A0A2M3ZW92_9DIPT